MSRGARRPAWGAIVTVTAEQPARPRKEAAAPSGSSAPTAPAAPAQKKMAVDLKGKVALVTGATSGIGFETADFLAAHGADVILGVRNVEAGQKIAKEIMAAHPGCKVEVGPSLDLTSQDSVKAFASKIAERKGPLNILVNNAGLGYTKKSFTEQGVGMLTQVNHLGPYTLTRMLESKLVASKARVVNVASVTHRITRIKDARALFTDWKGGFYQHNKLANVYFAFELQRRLGARGLQACVADPGAVRTNIYNNSPKLSKGLINVMINKFYAPPEDGAKAVIHAASCDWDADRPAPAKGKAKVAPQQDLRYYARGVFTWPQITSDWAMGGKGFLGKLKGDLWGMSTVVLSFLDWPLRRAFPGCPALSKARPCKPGSHAYDEKIASEIWDVSAEYAELPKAPQL
ncbi:hypothetical protein Rsub_03055 [Raphidocelis subcapitata]|uniref:Uncharacterized protein n=1 Tax=Raphidocelis subcapitata TaxID=307507 RepID=A0A2V0NSZ7_9CHLO|nr:hypothetical protein Rsub_03055 [Raphidocelis subcapitata]|eukprot:GBF90754.1 hypothetical protein Rsub_03055 [Raphidocelis subcapitata]